MFVRMILSFVYIVVSMLAGLYDYMHCYVDVCVFVWLLVSMRV